MDIKFTTEIYINGESEFYGKLNIEKIEKLQKFLKELESEVK